jgi:hypothetical protein
MTNAHTWTLTGLGLIALVVGALLASGAIGSAQEGSTTPTPSATEDAGEATGTPTPSQSEDSMDGDSESDSTDEGDTESEDAEEGNAERSGCNGAGKHLIEENAAEVLGITADELRTALQSGQTLAQVAETQGMSAEDFRAALETAVRADLQAQLDAGEITQEQFDEISAQLDTKLDEALNSTGGLRFRGGPRGDLAESEGGAGFRGPFQTAPEGTDA